jgi:hypothetical protein
MVDVSDLGILAANYGLTDGTAWPQGDFNGDGRVDVGDLGILAAHYGLGRTGGVAEARDTFKNVEEKADDPIPAFDGCRDIGILCIGGIAVVGMFCFRWNGQEIF